MSELLLEIYGEEIPPNSQVELEKKLFEIFSKLLKDKKIIYKNIETFSSARRITLLIKELQEKIDGETKLIRGPSVLSDEKSINGFMRSHGISSKNLLVVNKVIGKEYYFFEKKEIEQNCMQIFKNFIPYALKNINLKKSMRWSFFEDKWIRPIKNILCLIDSKVIEFEFAGIKSSNFTFGNYLTNKNSFYCNSFQDYQNKLEQNDVILQNEKRKQKIIFKLNKVCKAKNISLNLNQTLLEETSRIVENPNLLIGRYEKDYYKIPENFIISVLTGKQKYFTFRNNDGKVSNIFAFVTNHFEDKNEVIRIGNERVLKARLKDTIFFINEDKQLKLKDRFQKLENIKFYDGLGSLKDKSERVSKISEIISKKLNYDFTAEEKELSLLTLADQNTLMVKEFPNLQGYVGSYYAKEEGYSKSASDALKEQYYPNFHSKDLSMSNFSMCLSLAEKIDNIIACFLSGKKPSGSKDPYGIRRASLSVIKILIVNKKSINLNNIIDESYLLFNFNKSKNSLNINEIKLFIKKRLIIYLNELGFNSDIINSISNSLILDPFTSQRKCEILESFLNTENAKNFLFAFNRLKSITEEYIFKKNSINIKLFKQEEESVLYENITNLDQRISKNEFHDDYRTALKSIEPFSGFINNFFEKVQVNSDNHILKENRKKILLFCKETIEKICLFSKLKN